MTLYALSVPIVTHLTRPTLHTVTLPVLATIYLIQLATQARILIQYLQYLHILLQNVHVNYFAILIINCMGFVSVFSDSSPCMALGADPIWHFSYSLRL